LSWHLKVALISGGRYDGLYARFPEFEGAAATGETAISQVRVEDRVPHAA